MRDYEFKFQAPTASRGMVTVYSCVMMLLMMASILTYSTYTSIKEQTQSSNELKQKQAFHAAQAGLDIGTEWFLTQSALINADLENVIGDLDGFLFPGSERWVQCGDVPGEWADDKTHPCWGDPNDVRRNNTYFYKHDGSTQLPIDTSMLGSDVNVEVEALLCFIDVDLGILHGLTSAITGCKLLGGALLDNSKFMVTLLARGEAECSDGSCAAKALVSQKVTNFNVGVQANVPGVPLVANGPLPTNGILQLGANDDGGLPNPLSIWGNNNDSCSGAVTDFESSAVLTCPLNVLLDATEGGVGNCPSPTNLVAILNAVANGTVLSSTSGMLSLLTSIVGTGTDLAGDVAFPCDLFAYYFGVPESDWEIVRDSVKVINDCSALEEDSFGTYWVTGETCDISGTVGEADRPVMIISAATTTHLAADARVYGTMFLTGVEDASAQLTASDGAMVQGQVISDSTWGPIDGTLTVRYDEDLIVQSSVSASLGSVQGTWTDFHAEWE